MTEDAGLFGYGMRFCDDGLHDIGVVHGSTIDTESGAHYLSPYLTCQECNEMQCVNAATVQRALSFIPHGGGTLPAEVLPVCLQCGRTDRWAVGADDFSSLIGMSKEMFKLQMMAKKKASVTVQKVYRGHLGRLYAQRVRLEKQRREAAERRGAIVMQCLWRRRYAQRKVECLRSLRIIRSAHQMVLSRALHGWVEPGAVRVFWYKTQAELGLLWGDYRLLIQRSGNRPPVYVVEANINEIARRVAILLDMYATRIQCRWRGLVGREFLAVFRRELVRVREIRTSSAYPLQRTYRGWITRKHVKALSVNKWKARIAKMYTGSRRHELAIKRQRFRDEQLKAHYVQEKMEQTAARLTGKCLYEKGSFKKSAYSHDRLDKLMASYLTERATQISESKKRAWIEDQRAKQVQQRKGLHILMEKYYKDESKRRQELYISRVSSTISPFRTAGRYVVERKLLVEHSKSMPNVTDLGRK